MGYWVSSEENLSSVGINIFVNPSSPSGQCPCICIQNFESGVYMVAYLIIVFSVTVLDDRKIKNLYLLLMRITNKHYVAENI